MLPVLISNINVILIYMYYHIINYYDARNLIGGTSCLITDEVTKITSLHQLTFKCRTGCLIGFSRLISSYKVEVAIAHIRIVFVNNLVTRNLSGHVGMNH